MAINAHGHAICDAVAALIDGISTPDIKQVHRCPPSIAEVNTTPCAFVWLDAASISGRADNHSNWDYTIGICVLASMRDQGDSVATADTMRAAVENVIDGDRTLSGTCGKVTPGEWKFLYEPGGNESGSTCAAMTYIVAFKPATRGAN